MGQGITIAHDLNSRDYLRNRGEKVLCQVQGVDTKSYEQKERCSRFTLSGL
jgi:hypothetical protein